MQRLSAGEAIGPAWERTKEILFKQFRFGRSWKLAATTYLGLMGALYAPFCTLLLIFIPVPLVRDPAVKHWLTPLIIVCGILLDALIFWFFYLGSRLQFVAFDIVVFREHFVRNAWRKYGPQQMKWMLLKLATTSVLGLIALFPMAAFFFSAMKGPLHSASPSGSVSPWIFLVFLLSYGVLLLSFLISGLYSDFVLPSLALEDVSVNEALQRARRLIAEEPGSFAGYVFLKIVLAIVGWILHYIVTLIASIPAYIVMFLPIMAGWAVAAKAGTTGHLLGTAGAMLFYIPVMLWIGYVQLFAIGAVMVFLRCFAAYYLGGRYPLMGDILEPPGQSWWNPGYGMMTPPDFPPPAVK